jgi:hypothetical protein
MGGTICCGATGAAAAGRLAVMLLLGAAWYFGCIAAGLAAELGLSLATAAGAGVAACGRAARLGMAITGFALGTDFRSCPPAFGLAARAFLAIDAVLPDLAELAGCLAAAAAGPEIPACCLPDFDAPSVQNCSIASFVRAFAATAHASTTIANTAMRAIVLVVAPWGPASTFELTTPQTSKMFLVLATYESGETAAGTRLYTIPPVLNLYVWQSRS